MQQSVTLNRISTYEDAPTRIRSLIGERLIPPDNGNNTDKDGSGEHAEQWKPRIIQLYVWQTPIMCLNFGIVAFVVGFAVLVFGKWSNKSDSIQGRQDSMILEGKVRDRNKMTCYFNLCLLTLCFPPGFNHSSTHWLLCLDPLRSRHCISLLSYS
jgi:hypothetical protein